MKSQSRTPDEQAMKRRYFESLIRSIATLDTDEWQNDIAPLLTDGQLRQAATLIRDAANRMEYVLILRHGESGQLK